MNKPQAFATLRNILAEIYPEEGDARRVVNDAGIDGKHISFGAKAINNWTEILRQAEKERKTNALQAVTRNDYPENEKLSEAWDKYLTDRDRPSPLPIYPGWSLVKLIIGVMAVIGIGIILRNTFWESSAPTPTPPPSTAAATQANVTLVPGDTETLVPTTLPSPTLTNTSALTLSDIISNPKDGAIYVKIPAGMFKMGSTQQEIDQLQTDWKIYCEGLKANKQPYPAECDRPEYSAQFDDEVEQHEVDLADFWIMQTEVTVAQYARCVSEQQCTPPTSDNEQRQNYLDSQTDSNFPITFVDWSQALTYAHWVGGTLPTEAQWEKACRGPTGNSYAWGNAGFDPKPGNYRERDSLRGEAMAPVMKYPQSANGLFEMSGNVWEWTRSLNKRYPYDPANDQTEPLPSAPENRIRRGGSSAHLMEEARCASRRGDKPTNANKAIGFRVVLTDCQVCIPVNE